MPAGALERVHLSVKDCASLLNPAIVSAPQHRPTMNEHRADRNAALLQPAFRFFNGCRKESIHIRKFSSALPRGGTPSFGRPAHHD